MNAVPAIGGFEAALRSHYAGVRSRLMPAPLSDGRKADRQRDKASGAARRSSKTGKPKQERVKIDRSVLPELRRKELFR